jgi:membrane-bound metal-dependent hydrolase YbcI (DUF457 family)
MYPGHFAAGLALKAAEPRAPTLGLMIGVSVLDLVFAVAVAFGVEGGSLAHLTTPWSHSLVMSLIWAALFASVYWRLGRAVVAVMAAAVMSHWVLDALSHNSDMQLWPHSKIEIGLGPLLGGLGGWFELLLSLACVAIYVRWAMRPENARRNWPLAAAVIGVTYALEVAVVWTQSP